MTHRGAVNRKEQPTEGQEREIVTGTALLLRV